MEQKLFIFPQRTFHKYIFRLDSRRKSSLVLQMTFSCRLVTYLLITGKYLRWRHLALVSLAEESYIVYKSRSLYLLIEEKRWVERVAFDRSPLKLFTLWFSSKSVQAPSCKKHKTTRRTLFLSFEINNCLANPFSVIWNQ